MSTAVTIEVSLPDIRLSQFDLAGQLLAASNRRVDPYAHQPGRAEVDFAAISEAVLAALAECVTISGLTPEVISLTAVNDGLAMLSGDGNAVAPVITDADLRALPFVEQWIEQGIAAAGFRATGSAVSPGSMIALAKAIAESSSSIALDASLITSPLGALSLALTGRPGLPAPLAPLQVLDPYHATYDEELIDLFRLRQLRDRLPPVESGPFPLEPVAGMSSIRELVTRGCIVSAANPGIVAAMTASGAVSDGLAHVHLGSTLQCGTLIHRLDTGAEPGGVTITTPARQHWIRATSSPAGLAALDWVLCLLGSSYQELNALVAASTPGSGGVLAVPVMSGSGGNGMSLDLHARSHLTGFHSGTSRSDLARAMCEGIALTARFALNALGVLGDDPIHFTGAGVRAPAFRQLLADALGRPVLVHPYPEPIGRGAALTAFDASGHPFERPDWGIEGEEVEPSAQWRNLYDDRYAEFQAEVAAGRRSASR